MIRIQLSWLVLSLIFLPVLCSNREDEQFFRNPIIDVEGGSADPCVLKHNDFYYLIYTEMDKITVHKSSVFTNFRNAESRVIYEAPPGRANLWAPEMHFIRQNLYIYFTMDDGVTDENHRMYVIQADDPSNPLGTWGPEIRLLPEEERYGIDGTILQYGDGKLYYIWTGFSEPPGTMNLYIAPMESPTRVIPPRILLRTPKSSWEMHGFPVNEGPFVLHREGRTIVVFSASSTFTPDYCISYFGIDFSRDPLIPSNWWDDLDKCVFWRNDEESVFTTGHASFTLSPDGSETWMIYHATDIADANGQNRTARAQKITWNSDNFPQFPRPMGTNTLIPLPSGHQSANSSNLHRISVYLVILLYVLTT